MEERQNQGKAELSLYPYQRGLGLVLPVFSLPSPYGIGTMGKAAYDFIDYLKAAHIRYWQILPLGPVAFGNSPYSALSSYGGNPLLIDLDQLKNEGLLEEKDLADLSQGDPSRVDYPALFKTRPLVFQRAFSHFEEKVKTDLGLALAYEIFLQEDSFWLRDYALYCLIRKDQSKKPWNQWPEGLRKREKEALKALESARQRDLQYESFLQFIFFRQWEKLKSYAKKAGVLLIGDLPIYVAMDSADAWVNPDLLQLGPEGRPLFVSGAPPDYYNQDGQKWGNPLYDWQAIREEKNQFWINRLGFSLRLFDLLRLDHFLAYEHYWKIPAGASTAREGKWEKGPGLDFFKSLERALGPLPLIVEDLGAIDEKVIELREKTGFAGMCPLEFAFSSKDSPYLPHHLNRRSAAYSSTHDQEPLKGWWDNQDPWRREEIREYFHLGEGENVPWAMIRALALSRADLCLFSFQDIAGIGEEGRINVPGTVGENWTWRMGPHYRDLGHEEELRALSIESGRSDGKQAG